MIENGMNQVCKMVNYLDILENGCTAQLYLWHAVEAVKARLIKDNYPKKIKEAKDVEIHNSTWK